MFGLLAARGKIVVKQDYYKYSSWSDQRTAHLPSCYAGLRRIECALCRPCPITPNGFTRPQRVDPLRTKQNGRHFANEFSNSLSLINICVFWFKFHFNLFRWVQPTISQHWFRWWLGTEHISYNVTMPELGELGIRKSTLGSKLQQKVYIWCGIAVRISNIWLKLGWVMHIVPWCRSQFKMA